MKQRLHDYGYDVNEAVLDPYVAVWFFYECGKLVLTLDNETVERILGLLLWVEYQEK